MALITFQDLPSTSTPINANNLNNNFNELDTKIDGVVERGSNANGNYVKFSDGTMICYARKYTSLSMTTAWGSLYISESGSFTFNDFPQPFISLPYITYSILNDASQSAMGFIIVENGANVQQMSTTSPGSIRFARGTSASAAPYNVQYIAIGRWK